MRRAETTPSAAEVARPIGGSRAKPPTTILRASFVVSIAFVAAACADRRPSPTSGRTDLLRIELLEPADRGSPERPVTTRRAKFNVIARDDQGQTRAEDLNVSLFVSFGGVKTGALQACGTEGAQTVPIATLTLRNGQLLDYEVDLPQAFGPTSLWVEDPVTGTIGASDTISFRNPFIADLQKPIDPTAPNASFCTPWSGKFVLVNSAAQTGGKLVISSVFGNAVAVSDSSATEFGSIYLFTFGRPPSWAVPGRVLASFSGNISKFIGFTELNFPLMTRTDEIDTAAIPRPVRLVSTDTTNVPKLLSLVAAPVEVSGTLCDPLPPNPNNDPFIADTIDQWYKFNSFVVGNGSDCASINNFSVQLPAKLVGNFDPLTRVGQQVTIRGMLKNSSGQNSWLDAQGNPIACSDASPCERGTCQGGICKKNPFNFWTVVVRDGADVPQ
jgi:hypothetical protein